MAHNSAKSGSLQSGRAHLVGVAVLVVVVCGLVADVTRADSNNFYEDIIRLDGVATKVHQKYVEEIGSEELIDKAIGGMMEALDPHSSFFKRKQYEELRIHTEGKFGGLGIQISIRDKVLTVMTPISGTPAARAGIQSGDQIVEIDGELTKGITIDAAVNKLRGEPGTEVTINIRRKGEREDIPYTITREIITIKSVPFYGVISDKVGYLRLLAFSQEAGDEVEKAIRDLVKRGVTSVVFDLRHNPGGLLPEAKEVSEKFLARKSLVVSTRGRVRDQNKEFYASADPVLPADIPLVVLVNAASASASEIVAGAIQDWDRGLVLGDTTFGKGSVQSILPLDKDHHLKLTTAYYYTPSGRCINKPDNGPRSAGREDAEDEDMEAADGEVQGDSSSAKGDSALVDTTVYRTKGGRIVHGGGGIVPDTVVDPEKVGSAARALFLKDAFFKFANMVYPKLKKLGVSVDGNFVADDKMMGRFNTFLDTIDFEYRTTARAAFDDFSHRIGIVDSVTDSSAVPAEPLEWAPKDLDALKEMAKKIEGLLEKEARTEMDKSKDEIRDYVTESLLVREFGQDHEIVYRRRLSKDPQVQAALSLLRDRARYSETLKPGKN